MTDTASNPFQRFTALSFDCYGTLIDWERGIAAELTGWAQRHEVSVTVDQLVEAFGGAETRVQQQHPTMLYPEVLAHCLGDIGDRYGVTSSDAELTAFGQSVPDWPAFADTVEALQRLRQRYRLIILSNVDRLSFAGSLLRLGVEFDLVVTAEDVGAYKPSAQSFPALLSALSTIGVDSSGLLHVAQSLYHDHVPAKAVGLPTVWIDRRHDKPGLGATPTPSSPVQPDWRFTSLAAFADVACS